MLDLTKSNLVLTAGRQIFFLIIGALILSFGLTSEWPTNNVKAMIQEKYKNPATVNVLATALPTIAKLPNRPTLLSANAQAAANKPAILKASVTA